MKVNKVNRKVNKVNIYEHGLRKRAKASVKSGGIMTSGHAGPEKSPTQYGFHGRNEVAGGGKKKQT